MLLFLVPMFILVNTSDAQISALQFTNRMVERLKAVDPTVREISTPGIIKKDNPNNLHV
jgi:hypothetical protein